MKTEKKSVTQTNQARQNYRNSYYGNISARFGKLQIVLYLLLFVFIVSAFLLNPKVVTFRNFYYLLKDLNASAHVEEALSVDSLSYPVEEKQSFGLYRNGIVIAGKEKLTLFTAAGKQSLQQSVSFENPTVCGDGKYLLVYDVGSCRYSLYNSFTQVYEGQTEQGIRQALILESGNYAFCTKGTETVSEIHYFNKNFEKMYKYAFQGYVTSFSVNETVGRMAVVLTSSQDGNLQTTVQMYQIGESLPRYSVTVSDSIALATYLSEEGNLSLLCKNGWTYLSASGEISNQLLFETKELLSFSLQNGELSLLLEEKENSQKTAIVFDKSGKLLYNMEVNHSSKEIISCKNSIFIKNSDGITRVRLTDGATATVNCKTDASVMLSNDESGVFLCTNGRATYYRIFI